MPHINRAFRAHRAPTLSEQTQRKIEEAQRQAIERVLEQEGHPPPTPVRRTIYFPFGPIVLVVGLWLVAKGEPRKQFSPTSATRTCFDLFFGGVAMNFLGFLSGLRQNVV